MVLAGYYSQYKIELIFSWNNRTLFHEKIFNQLFPTRRKAIDLRMKQDEFGIHILLKPLDGH